MIPLQLTLKNFLSYREATLDFRGLHTACICGANGAGKSSLLEAITWVIWGKTRTATDEDLIYLGADNVRVDYQFISQQETYRIIRIRKRGGNISLYFQIESGGEFRSINEKTVKTTQDQIITTLKLDYDTFVNSAYLRQGRADEFMLRSAPERKKILAELLKLDQYEFLATQAKDLSKQYKGQAEQIQLSLTSIKQQLTQETDFKQQQEKLAQDIKTLQLEQDTDIKRLQEVQEINNQRKIWTEQLNWQQNQYKKIIQDRQRLIQEKAELIPNITKKKTLIDQESDINQHYQEFIRLQQEQAKLSEQFKAYQETQQQKQELEQKLLKIYNELKLQISQRQTKLESLQQQEQELEQILKRSDEVKSGLEQLRLHRQRLHQLDKLQHQVTPLVQRQNSLKIQIERVKANLKAKLEQLHQIEKQFLLELDKIPQRRNILQEIDGKIEAIEKKKIYQKRVQEKRQEKQLLKEKLTVNQGSYEEQIEELEQKLKLLDIPEAICPLCEQGLDDNHRYHVVEKTQIKLQQIQEQIWLIKEKILINKRDLRNLDSENIQLEREVKSYDSLKQDFMQVDAKLEEVGEIKIKLKKVRQEIKQIEESLTTETYGLELQSEFNILTQKLKELNYDEQTHALVRGEVDKWRKAEIQQAKIADATRRQGIINQQKPELIQKIQDLDKQIKDLYINSEIKNKINELEQYLKELGYEQSYHQTILNSLRQAQSWQLKYQELQQAKQEYPQLKERLESLELRLDLQTNEVLKIEEQMKDLSDKIATIKDSEQELMILEKQIQTRRHKLDECLGQQGKLEQSLSQLTTIQQQYEDYDKQFKEVRKKYLIYKELGDAFGKNGIQALMIENVLPQLEAETNQILSRLTGNQLYIQFITQKSSRSGNSRKKQAKMIDTLDIFIADSKGTRAYETYSGGESFRINFSIRLALANLLAQRAGTSLQMLIIDEGFGTQDAEGCDRLIAAINAISSDFSCILAVTHMPQFKEAFQNRIEVYKTNQGSQLTLSS
ncbi:exonuclease subunit SbcC [Aphanothece sacrum]|uniref:Nuclease SbcCD subunit C n=1 Tax=Aphanothece sacrum FPU1 TaxID=1920663 RepID=A0A401IMP5_APHSA|nr:exonuclease subunit SbcC [Aphanothece sacrum]GBF82513.1 exonuclease SbcC [Aphanothece sacrum FPU1]GBF85753.1 exonuclease SbcC [Aphanothece sacrum FPU3]